MTSMKAWWDQRPLLFIVLIALLLRLPGLATKPLWYDEAFAVLFSKTGPRAMAYGTLHTEGGLVADVHPLGYYTVLWGWGKLFGTSPIAARALSVFQGLGTVAIGYGLGRRLFDERAGRVAGLLLAASPFQVHYAQEVRMYSQLTLLVLAAIWVYWEALQRKKIHYWIGLAFLLAASLYTHNLAGIYLIALGCAAPFIGGRVQFGKLLLAGIGALVLYLPWLLNLPAQLARVEAAYWINVPGPADLVNTYLTYVGWLPIPGWALPILLFCSLLVGLLAILATVQGLRRGMPGSRNAVWLAVLAGLPVVIMYLVSQRIPVYVHRALLPAGAAFLILLAWAGTSRALPLATRSISLAALGVAFALGLFGYYTYRGFPYAPFSDLVAKLQHESTSNEAIVHSNKITALPSVYYAPDLGQHYLADLPGSGSDTLAPATQQVLGLMADAEISDAVGAKEGVWFVLFSREIDEYRSGGVAEHPAVDWLRDNFTLEDSFLFGELELHHFSGRSSAPEATFGPPEGFG